MRSFWYWEIHFEHHLFDIVVKKPHKILLVKDENDILKHKFDLTNMGFDECDTYEKLQELLPPPYYEYNNV